MPSMNMLASHKSSRQSRHHVRGSIAKFLLSFCGLASFGVVTTLIALSANNVYAESSNNTITANLPGSVAIRLLNAEGTAEISSLDFNNLTPTPQGTTASKSFIVDVATSNPTGYKLYMQSDYQDGNSNYTTNLVHTDEDVTDVIPTTTATSTLYWNYTNPLTHARTVIPAYGTPDKIGQLFTNTDSNQSVVDINMGVDTTTVSGTYENQLLFSAVGNPNVVDYSILYDLDGGTASPEITPNPFTDSAPSFTYSTTISSSVPEKSGFLFTHWDIVIPQGSEVVAQCFSSNDGPNNASSSTCQPGDTVVIYSDEDFNGDITLKAVYGTAYTYTVSYNCNGGTGCPGNTSYGPTTETSYSYVIPNTTIAKRGNNFDKYLDSNGVSYNFGDQVVLTSDSPSTVLTAQFIPYDITGITYMQEMKPNLCSNSTTGATATLIDNRDNNTYTIKKLNDGNCWMTQNLRLVGSKTLTSEDSDLSTNFTITASDSSTWCTTNSAACDDKSMVFDTGNTNYGAYYNWYTATAGGGTYSLTTGAVNTSICPKGWRLPTGGTSGEFKLLNDQYETYAEMISPDGPAFALGGVRSGATNSSQGSYGYYWSNTVYNASYAYNMYLYSSGVYPSNRSSSQKYRGQAIRCLAANDMYTLTVDPNGGVWNGSSETQTFTYRTGHTKTISNPTKAPSSEAFTIGYDGNGQGATYVESPTSAPRAFSNWALSGSGSFASGTYTFGSGNGTLMAQYDSSEEFTLPIITKEGYVCSWYENSTSGASHISGEPNVRISGDTTFIAVCTQATIDNINYMQEMVAGVCANSATGANKTLIDIRDDKTYKVQKLADNNCWMTEDLKFEGASLQSETSDVESEVRLPDNYYAKATAVLTDSNNYYTWSGANAGATSSSGASPHSICPKGWRLPSGGSESDFNTLYTKYSSYSKITSSPVNMNTGRGYYNFSTGKLVGNAPILGSGTYYSYYWSSTSSSDSAAYTLTISQRRSCTGSIIDGDYSCTTSNGSVSYTGGLDKSYGALVRCIAR